MPVRPSTAGSAHGSLTEWPAAARYPSPDPTDPFAPLWVLRSRQSEPPSPTLPLEHQPPPLQLNSRPPSPLTKKRDPRKSWRNILHRPSHSLALGDPPEPPPTTTQKLSRPRSSPRERPPRPQAISVPLRTVPIAVPVQSFSNTGSSVLEDKVHDPSIQAYLQAKNQGSLPVAFDLTQVAVMLDANSSASSRSSPRPRHYSLTSSVMGPTEPDLTDSKRLSFRRLIATQKTRPSTPVPPRRSSSLTSFPRNVPPPPPLPQFGSTPEVFYRQPSISRHEPSRPGTAASTTTTNSILEFSPTPQPLPSVLRNLGPSGRVPQNRQQPVPTDTRDSPTPTQASTLLGHRSTPKRRSRRPHTSPGRAASDALPPPSPPFRRLHTPMPTAYPPNPRPVISAPFQGDLMPTKGQLEKAARLLVIAESGVRVRFGDLWEKQRTVVCFIRHFWCPSCQDYMMSISQHADPAVLKAANINLIIISNGSHNMIRSYRQIFHTPFQIYTDPSLRLYRAMGMTLRTLDPGPESERPAYAKHGLLSGIAMVVVNAIKSAMPVWEKGGDISQLGGEFVLGPGLKCRYAHRMRTTRGHAPFTEVLAAAGVDVTVRVERESLTVQQRSLYMWSEEDEAQWAEGRRRSWARLQRRKIRRRMGEEACLDERCELSGSGSVEEGRGEVLPVETSLLFSENRRGSMRKQEGVGIWEAVRENHVLARTGSGL